MPATASTALPAWRVADMRAPSPFQWAGMTRFLPLALCGGFFVATVLLFAFGPLDWHVDNPLQVYGFLISATLALFGGYTYAVLKPRRSEVGENQLRATIDPNRWLIISAIVFLLVFFPTSYITTGKWIPDVWTGLTDAGWAYNNNKRLNKVNSPLILYIRMLLSPLTILTLPLTIFCWQRLSKLAKGLGVACIVAQVALYIAQGVNKGIAELSGYIILFLVLLAGNYVRQRRWGKLLRAIAGILVVLTVFVSIYSITMRSRVALHEPTPSASPSQNQSPEPQRPETTPTPKPTEEEIDERLEQTAEMSHATVREGHIFFRVVPDGLQPISLTLTSYLTHGYKGMSLAMHEEFTSSYGLGFSIFIRHNLMRPFGEDAEKAIFERTYNAKISKIGWVNGFLWSTFFIYPASDIGFPATVLLMALIGFGYGAAWRDVVQRGDPLAAVVFFNLCLLIFYLSANNQLFQNGESTIGFTAVLLAWLWVRNRKARRQASTGSDPER